MQSFGHSLWGWISHKTTNVVYFTYIKEILGLTFKLTVALINVRKTEKHNPESETSLKYSDLLQNGE